MNQEQIKSLFINTQKKNQELAKKEGYELIHYLETIEYSTMSQNRRSICTNVIQAIKHKDRLFNKIIIKKVETDLVRNYEPTKSTKENHEKKVIKLKNEFNIKV